MALKAPDEISTYMEFRKNIIDREKFNNKEKKLRKNARVTLWNTHREIEEDQKKKDKKWDKKQKKKEERFNFYFKCGCCFKK